MKVASKLIFNFIILLFYSSSATSQDQPTETVNHGAFSTMIIAAPNVAKYLETVKEDIDFFWNHRLRWHGIVCNYVWP